jgi:DNA-binding GntR family transcriptional regulator
MALSLPMRATTLADAAALRISLRQHRTMIELLGDTDNWALAQLCVEHVWPSKHEYLQRASADGMRDAVRSSDRPRRQVRVAQASMTDQVGARARE